MTIHRFCTSNAVGKLIFQPLDITVSKYKEMFQFKVPPLVLPEFKNKHHRIVQCNWVFPGFLVSLFHNNASCKTFVMKRGLTCMKINLISMVSHIYLVYWKTWIFITLSTHVKSKLYWQLLACIIDWNFLVNTATENKFSVCNAG